jgi:rare lipoprotein A
MPMLVLMLSFVFFFLLSGCQQKAMDEGVYPQKHERHDGPPQKPQPIVSEQISPVDEPLSRYGNPSTYQVKGHTYDVLTTATGYHQRGIASWYGTKFHEKRTSSGEAYDMYALTAAHKTLPLPTYVRVKNLENGREAVVKVNDRGPFHDERLIDLSYGAAVKLGILSKGTASVEVEALLANNQSQPTKAHYYLQAGAFQSQQKAKALCDKLRMPEADVQIEQRDSRYIVSVGPFLNKQASDSQKSALEEQGVMGVFSFLQ